MNRKKLKRKTKGFRRFIRRLFKFSVIMSIVISSVRFVRFIGDRRRRRRLEERRSNIVMFCAFMISAVAAAVIISDGLSRVKRRHGGYLVDLFDRDEYDVVDPEEEDEYEDIIRGELHKSDDDVDIEKLSHHRIPLDDETTVEDFKTE